MARYRAEGEAAFEPRSRLPNTPPAAIGGATVEPIVRLRTGLSGQGLDAGQASSAGTCATTTRSASPRRRSAVYLDR